MSPLRDLTLTTHTLAALTDCGHACFGFGERVVREPRAYPLLAPARCCACLIAATPTTSPSREVPCRVCAERTPHAPA